MTHTVKPLPAVAVAAVEYYNKALLPANPLCLCKSHFTCVVSDATLARTLLITDTRGRYQCASVSKSFSNIGSI